MIVGAIEFEAAVNERVDTATTTAIKIRRMGYPSTFSRIRRQDG
jgi:hypothetical protein